MINQAVEIFNVKPNTLQEFAETDPFTGNELQGVICRQSDYRYGAMVLFQVNDEPCEQVIYCTPKLEYPFNRNGDFNWPEISQLEIWDKLDGTNILAYWYKYHGQKYVSYKTRLSPILRNGKYGGFYSLWTEYVNDNHWVYEVIKKNPDYNLSFELYGSRNPITINYEIPLDVVLLFGVRQTDHVVRPPSQLVIPYATKLPELVQIEQQHDLTKLYESLRITMSGKNNGNFLVEGMVLYAFCNQPSWRQFKCKPEEIQKIHWAAGGIPWRELWNTAINSFEEGNSTFEYFVELLKEEYTDQQIGRSEQKVKRAFAEAQTHVEFVAKANQVWQKAKEQGFDITQDKNSTFRFMSEFFQKKEMRRVGSVILKQAGLL